MLLQDWTRLKARLYDAAWRAVRKCRQGHRPLSDPFLWHDFYRIYTEVLPLGGPLVESHLRIVGPIAGQIARRRFPMPFANAGKDAWDGQADIIHELIGLGNLGLLAAVEHCKLERGAFSTIANFWIRKFIREGDYPHDIFGIEGLVSPTYLPKRHVATFTVGLTGTKSVNQSDDDGGDYEIDLLDSEGRASRKYLQRHIGEGGARFLWRDEGTYASPRLKLPGSLNGGASPEVVSEPERAHERRQRDWQDTYFLEGVEDVAKRVLSPIELRVFKARFLNKRKPTHAALGVELNRSEAGIRKIKERAARKVFATPRKPGSLADYYSAPPPADLDEWLDLTAKRFPNATNDDRREAWRATGRCDDSLFIAWDAYPGGAGSFNSWDFAKVPDFKPKPLPQLPNYPTWTHSEPFAVAWLRRHGRKLKPWIKPTMDWHASHALAA